MSRQAAYALGTHLPLTAGLLLLLLNARTGAPGARQHAAPLTWRAVAMSPVPRMEAQGIAANGKLYVFGGFHTVNLHATARADAYDPATNTWTRIADMPEALTHSAVAVAGHVIYLVGGFVGNHPGPSTRHVWEYDTTTNRWSAGPPLPADRGAGAAAVLGRQLHFIGGGTRRRGVTDIVDQGSHYVLSLDGGRNWTSKAPLPNARNHLGAAALGGKVYAIGGQHRRNEVTGDLGEVDAYDPATNTWARVADLPAPRGHISSSCFVLDNRIYVIGGTLRGDTNGIPAPDVAAYDPHTNTWRTLTPLPEGRKSPVANAIGHKIIVATGNATSIAAPSNITWAGTFMGR